jgi:hypothetical protein
VFLRVVQLVRIRTGSGDPAELVRQKIEDFQTGGAWGGLA